MNNRIPDWMVKEVAEYDLDITPAPASVLDIGANVGAFALRCHKRWPEASVRCYEPVAENYRDLVENLKLTKPHSKLIQAYRFAVRNFNGRDKIFIGDQRVTCGFHQLGRQTNVTEKVMCVDAAEISRAELVKIDTEGCEVEIVSRLDLSRTRALVVEYAIVDGTPTTWVDSHAALYDGTIMGAPLPAGYQGTFDFNYVDAQWCDTGGSPGNTCDGEESDSSFFQVRGFGGYVNGLLAQLPENATQWTPNPIAAGLSGGAWIFYNHNPSYTGCADTNSCYTYSPQVGSGYCMAQKWAETKMGFASQNFARPAGDDKFSYDEDNVFTINSSNTTNGITEVYLVNSVSCANANTSPSLGSGIWGGSSVNGFFQVTGNGSPFTLGTKIFDVPSDWDTESGTWDANTSSFSSDANTAFGLLRWPNSPAILGLAGVSNTANANGNSTLTTISIPSLGMGVSNANADNVDLYDKFLNVLASNAAITRVDDTHFTVPVAFGTAQNTAYIASNGAAPYYWDDSSPKGDYAYTDWTWWPRLICEASRINALFATCAGANCGNAVTTNCNCDAITCETIYCNPFYDQATGGNAHPTTAGFDAAFTQEAGCIPFNPCNPSVICISPNGESFPVGHTWPFKTIQFDEQYGSGWQAEPQQVMVDLLYQQPHYPAIAPCTIAPFAWLEDGGICSGGGANAQYFPHAPMVECLITLPSNGGPNSNAAPPSLPSGITIGWSSPAGTNANCNNQPDNTLFPPGAVGFGLEAVTVWDLWSNECACIDSLGRFAPDYSENVLGCQ